MPFQVIVGATMKCTFGSASCPLFLSSINRILVGNMRVPAANVLDHVPNRNIISFNNCSSINNPAVASATAAAGGVLTPMPCSPATFTPWTHGSPTVNIGFMPALNDASVCNCSYGGVIWVDNPGQNTVQIP